MSSCAELDDAIRAAAGLGIGPEGIAIESGIELALVKRVAEGGSTVDYLLEKHQRTR
jgi:hypothetical protein